jgi:hypothetical protein
MARLTIIEDCSPYYIRFTHDKIDELIDYCQTLLTDDLIEKLNIDGFKNYKLPLNQAQKILSLIPLSQKVSFMKERVSLFITKPGHYYRAHKDGLNHRCSINYTIKILDAECITNWYKEEDLKDYKIDNLVSNSSRECEGFTKNNHIPVKTMIAKQGEGILFNTDLFHDWDNTNSKNLRGVLTLRHSQPGSFYFDDAKKLFFGI